MADINKFTAPLIEIRKNLVLKRRKLSQESGTDAVERIIKIQEQIETLDRAIEHEVIISQSDSNFNWGAV